MIVKLLTEYHLEFLSLKGGCRGSSESTHVKMPYCWMPWLIWFHRLEKYLNIRSFHEKSLKMKFALKSTGKALSD